MAYYKMCIIGSDSEKQAFLKNLGEKLPGHSKKIQGATIDAYSFGHDDALFVWNISSEKWNAMFIPTLLKEAKAIVIAGTAPDHFADPLKGMTTINSDAGFDKVISQLHTIMDQESARRPSKR